MSEYDPIPIEADETTQAAEAVQATDAPDQAAPADPPEADAAGAAHEAEDAPGAPDETPDGTEADTACAAQEAGATPDAPETTPDAVEAPAAPNDTSDTLDTPAETPDKSPDAPAFRSSEAEKRLLALQQELRALKIPVVIVLEGWAAAGKGAMAGELLEGLDPRGYQVHVPERFDDRDALPPLKPYWTRMPRQGGISLFIGSYYHALCARAVAKETHGLLDEGLTHLAQMEQMLRADGVVLLKFFINIPRKEQKRRLRAMEQKKATRGLVSKADWRQNERYDRWQAVYNQMLADGRGGVWHVLRGEDKQACKQQLYETVTGAFEQAIAERKSGARDWDTPTLPGLTPTPLLPVLPLSEVDPDQALEGDYKALLREKQKRLHKLQYELYRKGVPMVLAFEGWDAAGKGGSIRRLTSALDPRACTVVPIASPTPEEKEHHHLWRFWRTLPRPGDIVIYDRTWYGRVMVERLEGFCTEAQWQRAYEEMNLFEQDLVQSGFILRKFWLHISPDEQLRRFIARRDDPEKQWKITDEDWRNRENWPLYEQAVNDMLQKTSTPYAPWTIVESNDKRYARIKVLDTVIAAAEERLGKERK